MQDLCELVTVSMGWAVVSCHWETGKADSQMISILMIVKHTSQETSRLSVRGPDAVAFAPKSRVIGCTEDIIPTCLAVKGFGCDTAFLTSIAHPTMAGESFLLIFDSSPNIKISET